MTRRSSFLKGAMAAVGMALLILDARTAFEGAQSGISLCIQTVIPSLFPFFVLSILLTNSLMGTDTAALKPICRLLRIPVGAGPLILAGVLGGYPVGAQCVSNAYEHGWLSATAARRMLAFCSNCGPAFIFGMVGGLFSEKWIPWALWVIHLISAMVVSFLIPARKEKQIFTPRTGGISFYQAVNRSLRVMASVCGWVVLFRVMIRFLQVWFLWYLPVEAQAALCGLLELSNGCVELSRIEDTQVKFLLCAGLLGFGGLCVTMQTYSVVTDQIDRKLYFPGKVLQGSVSVLLAVIAQILFNGGSEKLIYLPIPAVIAAIFAVFVRKMQNNSSICEPVGV